MKDKRRSMKQVQQDKGDEWREGIEIGGGWEMELKRKGRRRDVGEAMKEMQDDKGEAARKNEAALKLEEKVNEEEECE